MRPSDPLATAERMRAIDRAAISHWGIPGAVLMETAGRACAERLERLAENGLGRVADIVCGPGNNGGDGLVVARVLASWGWTVRTWFAGCIEPSDRFTSETQLQLRLARSLDLAPRELARPGGLLPDQTAYEALRAALGANAPDRDRVFRGVAVDAVFGTGLARPVAGVQLRTLEELAGSGAAIFAIDVPSGLDADTGEELGFACPARWTSTLAACKPGLLTPRGRPLAGELELAEIGIPRPLLDALPRVGSRR